MNRYELALVVSAKIDDESRAAVVSRAKSYIERFGGQVGETEEWGKRKLAYEINKEREGFYYFIQFESEGDCPNELEKRMRIMDNVLRYLTVCKDENDTFKVTPDKGTETPVDAEAEAEAEAPEAVEVEPETAEETFAEETAPETDAE